MYSDLPLFIFTAGSVNLANYVVFNLLKDIKVDGMIFCGGIYKRPELGALLKLISDVAFKIMPDRTKLFKPDFTRASRNPNTTKMMEEDPLVNHDRFFAGNIRKVMELQDKFGID